MQYKILNEDHLEQIKKEKLGNIEIEVEKLILELKLANLVGIDNDQIVRAKNQLQMLEVQHDAVTSMLGLEEDEVDDDNVLVT